MVTIDCTFVMSSQANIQYLFFSWIPGRAPLARNDMATLVPSLRREYDRKDLLELNTARLIAFYIMDKCFMKRTEVELASVD